MQFIEPTVPTLLNACAEEIGEIVGVDRLPLSYGVLYPMKRLTKPVDHASSDDYYFLQ